MGHRGGSKEQMGSQRGDDNGKGKRIVIMGVYDTWTSIHWVR